MKRRERGEEENDKGEGGRGERTLEVKGVKEGTGGRGEREEKGGVKVANNGCSRRQEKIRGDKRGRNRSTA